MPVIEGWAVVSYAVSGGFLGSECRIAVAVAKAESGWNTDARLNTSAEDSRGLWQINWKAHPNFSGSQLYDPTYNAQAAWTVYGNAGHRWTPWTTYTRGTYERFLGDADTAIAKYRSLGGNPDVKGGGGNAGPEAPADSSTVPVFGSWDPAPHLRYVGDALMQMGINLNIAETNMIILMNQL